MTDDQVITEPTDAIEETTPEEVVPEEVSAAEPKAEPTETDRLNTPPLAVYMLLIEVGLLIFIGWFVTARYREPDINFWVKGPEIVPLVGSGSFASLILEKTGRLPLWNPFMGHGEPTLEAVLSFILNPLIFLPFLAYGIVNGAKVTVILHVILMGIGGWTLGRVLGMRQFGRVLLGIMLLGLGGFAVAIGWGWFQIALSIAYIPWLLATLIAILYRRGRWSIVLFAVMSFLFVSTGSYWYTLPLASLCLPLIVVALVGRDNNRFYLEGRRLRRLIIALLLAGLLSAIRLLPQFYESGNFFHNNTGLLEGTNLQTVIGSLFTPTYDPVIVWTNYNYTLSPLLLALAIIAWLVISPSIKRLHSTLLNIMVPTAIGTIPLIFWAMEGTDFNRSVYQAFPFLLNWRWTPRVLVPVSIWLIVIVVLLLDSAVYRLRMAALGRERLGLGLPLLNRQIVVPKVVSRPLALGVLVVFAVLAINEAWTATAYNWNEFGWVESRAWVRDWSGVRYLRSLYPTQFLSIDTQQRIQGDEFYDTLSRTVVGNPEIASIGSPPTIGGTRLDDVPTQYAAGHVWDFLESRPAFGYKPVPGAPINIKWEVAWEHPQALDYAFTVKRSSLDGETPMTRDETRSVTYYHRIQSVLLTVDHYDPEDILVIQEVAYPGWQVTINGTPAQVESISHYLGVVLPADGQPVEVEFVYRPTVLYVGAAISLFGFLFFVVYAMRLDKRFGWDKASARFVEVGIGKYLLPVGKRLFAVLTKQIDDED